MSNHKKTFIMLIVFHALAFILALLFKLNTLAILIQPGASLLACVSLWFYTSMEKSNWIAKKMANFAFLIWFLIEVGIAFGLLSHEPGYFNSQLVISLETAFFCLSRFFILLSVVALYYYITRNASPFQVLADLITLVSCVILIIWLMTLAAYGNIQQSFYMLSDYRLIFSFVIIWTSLLTQGILLLVWFYYKERKLTIGHKMGIIGLYLISCTDTVLAVDTSLLNYSQLFDLIYVAGALLVAAGGTYFDKSAAHQLKTNGSEFGGNWKNGFYFLLYPLFAAVFTGLDFRILVFFLIIAFYMVSCMYTHQIQLTNKLLEESKAANLSLSNQAYFTSQVLEAMPNGIFYTDEEERILGINGSLRSYYGVDKKDQQVLGQPLADFSQIKSEEYRLFKQLQEKTLLTGLPAFTQTDLANGHGKKKTALYSLSTYNLADGSLGGYLGIFTDISELKEKEAELERALKEAKCATEAKSQFLANMSHEIRTPMNAIIGMSHLALQTDLTEDQKDYVAKILGASTALLRILNDILDFSKIESGKLSLEIIDFSLEKLVNDIILLISDKAKEKQIEVSFTQGSDISKFYYGDPLRLGQILANLIGNAIKFTESGKINISVEENEKFDNYVELLFKVTDSGIGISEEKIKRLFEPFSQSDNSITRNYGGSGLGLSISRNLVEMMDGKIWVESKMGEGSTFFFTVKLQRSSNQELSYEANTIELLGQKLLLGVKILLVEDNPVNRQIAVALLTNEGAAVDEAQNGQIAVEKIKESNQFDLILMDLQMPVMDGLEATRKIRSFNKNIPIIAMTARSMDNERVECLRSGMNDHIAKPFEPGQMLGKIYKYLNKTKKGINNKNQLHSEETRSHLLKISQIDWVALMKRLGNDWQLAVTLITVFLETHQKMGREILQAVAENDLESVKKLVHTAKGVLGNIDATDLYKQAVKLEDMLIKNYLNDNVIQEARDFENNLNGFYQAAQKTITSISFMDKFEDGENIVEEIDEVIAKLMELLDDGDSQAVTIFNENRQRLIKTFEPEIFKRLEGLIRSYQFDGALAILDRAR